MLDDPQKKQSNELTTGYYEILYDGLRILYPVDKPGRSIRYHANGISPGGKILSENGWRISSYQEQ